MSHDFKTECPICGEAVTVLVDSEQIDGGWVTHGVEIDMRGCEHELVYDHEGLHAKDDNRLPPRRTFEEYMAMPAVDEDGDDEPTKGLVFLDLLEKRLRRYDLAQIGYLFLTQIGEANHNSWDSIPREELIGINNFFHDMIVCINMEPELKARQPWGFGAAESWDVDGKRSFKP
jgi:hypothetical protein